jgi:hypothetical protein
MWKPLKAWIAKYDDNGGKEYITTIVLISSILLWKKTIEESWKKNQMK